MCKFLEEKFCAKCGKRFIPAIEHIFKEESKTGIKWYCKWTCYNHRNDNKRPNTKRVIQCNEQGMPLRVFDSTAKAAAFIGGKTETVRKYIYKKKPYRGFLWRYEDEPS